MNRVFYFSEKYRPFCKCERVQIAVRTSQELQTILALKGTKRNDQQVLIDLWGLSASSSSSAAAVTAAAAAANKMIHKTTSMLHPAHANTPSSTGITGIAGGHSNSSYDMNSSHNNMMNSNDANMSSASSAASSAASAAFSSMKSLTQDISSSTRNMVGNLKWTK